MRAADGRKKQHRQADKPLAIKGAEESSRDSPQTVELKFPAPAHGKYDLTLYCVSGASSSCLYHRWPMALPLQHSAGHEEDKTPASVLHAQQKSPSGRCSPANSLAMGWICPSAIRACIILPSWRHLYRLPQLLWVPGAHSESRASYHGLSKIREPDCACHTSGKSFQTAQRSLSNHTRRATSVSISSITA